MLNQSLSISLADEDATVRAGQALGEASQGGAVIFLHGVLGAGKTTLSRGVLRAFGHSGAVKSPTYTLVEPYELPTGRIYHFDLYRLADPEELEYMGVRDYFAGEALCLIEWPERGLGFLPEPDISAKVAVAASGRMLELSAHSAKGTALMENFSRLLPSYGLSKIEQNKI